MPRFKKTVKRARRKTVTRKRRYTKRRYKKRTARRRINTSRTGYYSGSEKIFLRTFDSLTNQGFIERFDLVQFPRLCALAPEFKHVRVNRAVVSFVPRQSKQAWYNAASTQPNTSPEAQGRNIITYIKKDGSSDSDAATTLQEARLEANAKSHNMQYTTTRSFIPYCIQKKKLVTSDDGSTETTAELVQMCNPWLDTVDPATYTVDRTCLGVFSPQLAQASTPSSALDYRWDMYVKIYYTFKGVNHVTQD